MADRQPQRAVFRESFAYDVLPQFNDPKLVATLLTSVTFKSSAGINWGGSKDGIQAQAATTHEAFSIVPENYAAAAVRVETRSCVRCHETTLHHSQEFARNPGQREWYGRVRGSDGIFSFHPFSPESISTNGGNVPTSINSRLVASGHVAFYDRRKHPADMYHMLDDYNPARGAVGRTGTVVRGR